MKVHIKGIERTGKEWKRFFSGLDFMDDNAIYNYEGDISVTSIKGIPDIIRFFINKPKKHTLWNFEIFK